MKIRMANVFVSDQEKALAFYTSTLGFEVKHDVPAGEYRWLTVVSPDEPDAAELLLEPDAHPAARDYTAALYADGIPALQLQVTDVAVEYERLSALGVRFTGEPTDMGPVTFAILDDTVGNYVQLAQYA